MKKKTSKFNGVSKNYSGRWVVHVRVNKESMYIGTYDSEIEAAKEYDYYADHYQGKKAKLNFPKDYA